MFRSAKASSSLNDEKMKHKKPKLIYFPIRGRGEHIRQALKLAGVHFEDVHVSFDLWPQFKGEMPLGHVPVLEVDGVKIADSKAIARFVGQEYGLTPANSVERGRLDMIADVIGDFTNAEEINRWAGVLLGMVPGVTDKAEFYREQIRPIVEKYAGVVEKYLVDRGTPLLNGDKATWVDVYAAEAFSKAVDYGKKDALDMFPHVRALVFRVHNLPAIRDHINHRKPTPF